MVIEDYYNQYVIVEGTIVDTHNSGTVCFLNFDTDYQYFTAVIFALDFLGFPFNLMKKHLNIVGINQEILLSDLETLYDEEYNGSPEIIVKTPGQIRIPSQNQHIFWGLL